MSNDAHENPSEQQPLRDLPATLEDIGFRSEDMLACGKCGRKSAPNRPACMYCGAEIEGATVAPKIEIVIPESWENGFNVVLDGGRSGNVAVTANALRSLLELDDETAQAILTSSQSLPVARVETQQQAEIVLDALRSNGFEGLIVSDEILQPNLLPVRLRSFAFEDDSLTLELFNTGERVIVGRSDLALIVRGILFESRNEAVETRKRNTSTTRSETVTSSDVSVIDIYSRQDPTGWRVPASGFDFSSLGPDKAMLVAENMNILSEKLREFSPGAKLIDTFGSVRSQLEYAWPTESRKDTRGIHRGGFGRTGLNSVYSTNNSLQLTKYSRLQWHLL